MLSDTLVIDEAIRLEKLTADEETVILETGRKEGSKRIYSLQKAREYTLEYSASLEGKAGERDFLFIDTSSPLLPRIQTRGEQEIVLLLPQSYSALSSLKRESLSREDGLKRYRFVGEGEWHLALARYFEIPFLSGKVLLLEDTTAVIALRALEEGADLVSERMGGVGSVRTDIAAVPDTMSGSHTLGGVFVEKRAFTEMESLPLLLERFFDVPWVLQSPEEEKGFLETQMKEYLVSETLKRVLSTSQFAALGMKEKTLFGETREFLGADAFDKLLQLIIKKTGSHSLSKADLIREFDELSWKPGTGDFLREQLQAKSSE
jgi:hypothetical protein